VPDLVSDDCLFDATEETDSDGSDYNDSMYAAAASLQATNVKSFNQGQVIELEIWLCQYRQLKSYLASRLSGMLDCKTNTTFYRHIDEIPMGVLRGGKMGICRLRTNILYKT